MSPHRQSTDIPADLSTLIRIGTVIAVDLSEARCTVRYGDPDDDAPAETPAIRWLTPRAGNTRIWSPPSVGEQVLLVSPDGQLGASVAITGIVQDAFPAVGNSEAELIEFADGARIQYDPESSTLAATLPAGGTAEVVADGGITLRGDVTIEGDVQITGDVAVQRTVTAADNVIADGVSLTAHAHTGVSSGMSTSGPPD